MYAMTSEVLDGGGPILRRQAGDLIARSRVPDRSVMQHSQPKRSQMEVIPMFGVPPFLRLPAGRALAGVLGAGALLLVLAPASAAATVTRVTTTTPTFDSGLSDDCRPGLTGTLVGTSVVTFQRVDTPLGFHIDQTETDTGTITWSDGSYSIIESVDHLTRNIFDSGMRVKTNAHEDSVNTYTADGVFLFRETFHEIEHLTFIDDVYRVRFDRGHFHVFGGC